MRHDNALLHEYWEPFIRFLDSTTSLLDGNHLNEWLQASRGHEIERITGWFINNEAFDIGDYIQGYFNSLASKTTDTCIGCECKFEQADQPLCIQCGLDFSFLAVLVPQERSKAIETMQMIHANRLALVCEQAILEQSLGVMAGELRLNEEYSTKRAALEGEIQELQTYISKHETDRLQLMQLKDDMETIIRTMRMRSKQSGSLYKRYTDRNPQYQIIIKSEETKLMAKPLHNTDFPIDLVAAFHRKPPDGGLIGAVCHIIIPEKAWRETASNIWVLDMASVVSGKVSGSFYLQFSSMQRSGEHINIDYSTKNTIFFHE